MCPPPPPAFTSHSSPDDYLEARYRKLDTVKRMHHDRVIESLYQLERDLPLEDPLRATFHRLRCEVSDAFAELIARDRSP